MSKSIEVILQPDGHLEIDAVGFKGADCEQATAFLEEALGTTAERKHKPEYHARTRSSRQQQVGQ